MSQVTLVERSSNTPEVLWDQDNNILSIKGRIISDNPHTLFEFLKTVFMNDKNVITLNIDVDYINSSSFRFLSSFIINTIKTKEINWYIDTDDMFIDEKANIIKSTYDSKYKDSHFNVIKR